MQKHNLPAESPPPANIFNNLTMDIHSHHPYLLGFDNNFVPNSNILVFQPYLGEVSEYSEESGRFACKIQRLPLGTPRKIGKIV